MNHSRELTDDILGIRELPSFDEVDGWIYLQNLKNRRLTIDDVIDADVAGNIAMAILRYNQEDKGIESEQRQPIILYISSDGGDVNSGLEIIDAIECSKTPIYTVNLGLCYSMAMLISMSGKKRFAFKNATFLLHDGVSCVYNSGGKVQDQIKFNQQVESKIKKHVMTHSSIEEKEYDEKLRVEWYMFADEAKDRGIVDYIIGQDCDVDAIV